MDKLKKIWKELSVFGVVLVVILGLYVYRLIVHVDYTTLSEKKFIAKVEDQDSFVVFTGSASSSDLTNYKEVVETYLKKNRGTKIYYIDLDHVSDTFITEYLDGKATTSTTYTFKFENGKIVDSGSSLTYYYLDQLVK